MKISVIVPTLDRAADLKCLLGSLRLQTAQPYEIIVVDQSAGDQTKHLVEEYNAAVGQATKITYYHQAVKSLTVARNAGLARTSGEIVSYIDDDIELAPDYLEKVLGYFKKDPKLGGVSGNVHIEETPSGLKWQLRKALWRLFLLNRLDGKMTVSGFGYPIFMFPIEKVTPVELFPGYSMNFRRKYLLREAFDEWFTGYSFREDVELSYRISRLAPLIMVPDARFRHNHSQVNRLGSKQLRYMQFKNYYHVFMKNKRTNDFSEVLFVYSLCGIIVMDLLEWLFSLKLEKFLAVRYDLEGAFALARRH